MVTVFNPQALGDPGPTAASGIIGAGLSSATGLLANRKNNQIELLKQLLGTGGTMLGNELERRSEAEQGRAGLKVLQEMGVLPSEVEGVDLNKVNIDPTTVNAIMAAQNPNRQMSAYNSQANFGKTLSESGDPTGTLVLQDAAQRYKNRFSTPTQAQSQQAGLGMQSEPVPQPVAGTGGTKYALGAQATDATQPSNLFMQNKQLQVAKQQQELEQAGMLTEKQRSLHTASPAFLNGVLPDGTPATGLGTKGAIATDANNIPLETSTGIQPMTPKLYQNHAAFNKLADKDKADIANKVQRQVSELANFNDLALDVVANAKKGTLNRIRLALAAGKTMDEQITILNSFDPQTPEEVAAITYLSQLVPLAIETASQFQGANSISNKDLDGILRSLGSPLESTEVFQNNVTIAQAKNLLSNIRNAAATNASAYKDLVGQYERLTGKQFNYDRDIDDLNGAARLFKYNLQDLANSRQEMLGQEKLGLTAPQMGPSESIVPQKSVARPTARPAAKSAAKPAAKSLQQQLDEELKLYDEMTGLYNSIRKK